MHNERTAERQQDEGPEEIHLNEGPAERQQDEGPAERQQDEGPEERQQGEGQAQVAEEPRSRFMRWIGQNSIEFQEIAPGERLPSRTGFPGRFIRVRLSNGPEGMQVTPIE